MDPILQFFQHRLGVLESWLNAQPHPGTITVNSISRRTLNPIFS